MKEKSVQSINMCQSLVQTIYDNVKAHDGELKVASKGNAGTTFTIELPILY
jgi:signal transduction histidine kinase